MDSIYRWGLDRSNRRCSRAGWPDHRRQALAASGNDLKPLHKLAAEAKPLGLCPKAGGIAASQGWVTDRPPQLVIEAVGGRDCPAGIEIAQFQAGSLAEDPHRSAGIAVEPLAGDGDPVGAFLPDLHAPESGLNRVGTGMKEPQRVGALAGGLFHQHHQPRRALRRLVLGLCLRRESSRRRRPNQQGQGNRLVPFPPNEALRRPRGRWRWRGAGTRGDAGQGWGVSLRAC